MSDVNVDSGAVPAWRERKNLMLAGAVGVAVLLLGAYFLLFSGGSSDEDTGLVVSARDRIAANGGSAGAAGGPSASASPTGASTLPAVFDEDIYGDPFAPLYPAAPTPRASTPAAPTTVPVAAVPVTTAAPVPEGPATEEPTRTTASIRLVRVVDQDTVIVNVNGSKEQSVYDIGVSFGGYFTHESTRPDEDEATFLFGDGSPFTLSESETKKFDI